MKKRNLLLALLLFFAISTQAQLNENFDAVDDGGIPTGWTRFNVDGLTPATNVAYVNEAWIARKVGPAGTTNKALISTSWYNPAGTANDWVFTPAVQVPATNPYLSYDIVAFDPSYPDGYEVRIMTEAPTSANLMTSTVLKSFAAAESGAFAEKFINLSAYAGQTVYIAWRNNTNDKYLLALDNVKIISLPPALDLELTSINMKGVIITPTCSIKGTVKNLKHTDVTSFDVAYTIDGGTPSAIYSVTGINLAKNDVLDFTHNVPATFTVGSHTVKVKISNVNGGQDTLSNNELTKQIAVASQVAPQKTLFEGFSSSTCAPCKSWNAMFNPWAESHSADMNYIKYQVKWPTTGDPYNIPDCEARVSYYGVDGVPNMLANGADMTLSVNSLNAAIATQQTAFKINTTTPSYSGKIVTIPVSITPYAKMTGKVHVAICEKTTTGNVGNNGETSFHHVLMGMAPNATGTTVNFVDGTPYTITLTKDMTSSHVEEMSDLIAVVFIQDDADKTVYQSATFPIGNIGLNDVDGAISSINIYPNPAKDMATLDINLSESANTTIQVTDLMGRNVIDLGAKSMKAGQTTIELNTSNLTNGMYFVKVSSDKGVVTKKITINR